MVADVGMPPSEAEKIGVPVLLFSSLAAMHLSCLWIMAAALSRNGVIYHY